MTRPGRATRHGAARPVCLALLVLAGGAGTAAASGEEPERVLGRSLEAQYCPASDDPLGTIHPARLRAVDLLGETGRLGLLAMAGSRGFDRDCALDYLASLDERRAIPLLRTILADSAEPVGLRGRAIRWLAALDDRESIGAVADFLRSDDRYLFRSSVEALAVFGGPRARAALRAVVAAGRYPAGYRGLLVSKIGELRDVEAIPLLVTLAEGADDSRRLEIVRALAAIGTPEALTAAGAIGEAMTRPGLRRLVTRELARRPGARCHQATTSAGEQDAAADVAARCR
jgi:hypothetical protein